MIFTAAAKAELIAFIETLDPSVDTAPLQERIIELEAEVARLSAVIDEVRALNAQLTTALA